MRRVLVAAAVVLVGIQVSVAVGSLGQLAGEFSLPPLPSRNPLPSETVRIDGRGGGRLDIGSGVSVGAHVVLTNAHVTSGRTMFVTRCDDSMLSTGRVERAANGVDLAAVVTDGPDLTPIELAPEDPEPGDEVTMIGYPWGERTIADARIEGSFVRGGVTVLRFSPEPHPGQSGSPLIDADGRLVGIAFAQDTVGAQGFAIPVSDVRAALDAWQAAGIPVASSGPGDASALTGRAGACTG